MKNGIVVAFEQFNPPTRFHIEFVQRVIQESKNYGYDYVIYNRKKGSPLEYLRSTYWTNKILGEDVVKSYSSDNLLHVLEDIKYKYKNVVLVGTEQTIVEGYSVLNEVSEAFNNFSFIEQAIFEPNMKEILTEAYFHDDYMYLDEVLVENLEGTDKQIFITEMLDGYRLYENDGILKKLGQAWDDFTSEKMTTGEFLKGTGKLAVSAVKGIGNLLYDASGVATKFFELIGELITYGFHKQPAVGGLIVLYVVAKRFAKKKGQDIDDIANPETLDARKAFKSIKDQEIEKFEIAHSRQIDRAIHDLEGRYTPKSYVRILDHAHERDIPKLNKESLYENLTVGEVNHAVHKISKYQGISFEDKAKLTNAVLAIRTQQYKEAERILSGVSDVVKMEIIANLRPTMDIEDLDTVFSKKVSPWNNFTNNVGNKISHEIGRRILPVGLGATAGYYFSGAAGIEPEVGAAIGGAVGYLSKGLGFKAYNKYKDLTEPQSDYERLQRRVDRLERKSNGR